MDKDVFSASIGLAASGRAVSGKAAVGEALGDPYIRSLALVDRTVAKRAGLIPLRARDRWAETWTIAALNAWLNSIGPVLAV